MIFHDVEQGELDWHEIRLGLPTASQFGRLITPKGAKSKAETVRKFRNDLLGEEFSGYPSADIGDLPAIAWGREHEPASVVRYEALHLCETRPIGIVTTDARTWGASPDRVELIDPDGGVVPGNIRRVLECKNPQPGTHVAYALDPSAVDARYRAQVYGQMIACGVEESVLLSNHPAMPEVELVIELDQSYASILIEIVEEFVADLAHHRALLMDRGYRSRGLNPRWVEQFEAEQARREAFML